MDETGHWKEWFGRRGPALILFARQWTATHADAEDIVQEAFVRFWRSRPGVDDPEAFLFACVRRCALDAQRTQSRRTRRERAVARPEDETLFDPCVDNERRDLVETALARLPDEQREVLVMKTWGGLTFPQIAEALQISVNTAASRYRYALARLRGQLAKEPIP